MAGMTYAIVRLRAHIETGEDGRDAFGGSTRTVLCGAYIPKIGGRTFVQFGMAGPMFYPVCRSCLRVQAARARR